MTIGQLGEHRMGVLLTCQPVHDSRGREHTGVGRGGRRGENDEVDDVDADEAEHLHERRLVGVDEVPWLHRHDDAQGQYVEDDHTRWDGVDGSRQVVLRVGSLSGSGTSHLDALEREDGDLEASHESHESRGEEAAAIPQVGDACWRCAGDWGLEGGDGQVAADQDERHDGDDLDHGEPELHLAEDLHCHHVESGEQDDDDEGWYPLGLVGEPFREIAGDGRRVGDADDDPTHPVGPANVEAGPRADEVGGEICERLVGQVRQQQLAHGSHDEEQEEPDDEVDQQDRRSGQADRAA